MIINHNITALRALAGNSKANKAQDTARSRLAAGLRIRGAADDAAGLAISEKMRGQIRGLSQASRNIQDGISLVQLADGALGEITEMLQRQREIAVQAANGTLTQEDRQALQQEVDQLKQAIDRTAYGTSFNDSIKPLVPVPKDSGSPPPAIPDLDIVFFIDNSSTMGTQINMVKNGIDGFLTNLGGISNAQVAMVDLTDDNIPVTSYPFSNDITTLKSQLTSFANVSGSSTQPYTRMQQALPSGAIGSGLGYRSGAHKVFVVLTDTGSELENSGYNESGTQALLEGAIVQPGNDSDDYQTFVFNFGGSAATVNSYDSIVSSTGGKFYTPVTAADVTDALSNDLVTTINGSIPAAKPHIGNNKIAIQLGANSGQNMVMELSDIRTATLNIDTIAVDPPDLAGQALDALDIALGKVSFERSKYGAYQNRLEHSMNMAKNEADNLTATESKIRDADIAKEAMSLSKAQIMVQSSQAMIVQANQQPQSVLQLLHS